MGNENYDELVRNARIRAREMRLFHQDPDAAAVSDLANAVEQLQKEYTLLASTHQQMYAAAMAQISYAELRIADLREALGHYEKAESVTFPPPNRGDPHGSCDCGHPERHAYASGSLMSFAATSNNRNIAKEALAADDEAAKK